MTDENKAISVNRWRLVLGGMSDKSLSFTGNKAGYGKATRLSL